MKTSIVSATSVENVNFTPESTIVKDNKIYKIYLKYYEIIN